jgi:hypothetical protein
LDPDGSDRQDYDAKSPQSGNVVRLIPRDWLGSTDELVPFGPSARRESDPDDEPTAQSFWTEDSASLHAAVNVAETEQAPPAPALPRLHLAATGNSTPSWTRLPIAWPARVPVRAIAASLVTLAVVVIAASALMASTPRHPPARQPARNLSASIARTATTSPRANQTRQ